MVAAGGTKFDDVHFNSLRRELCHLKETIEIGLDLVTVDIASVLMAVLWDETFANAVGMKKHQGLVILLTDEQKQANTAHYGSTRRHRVSWSVVAAAVDVLAHAFDIGFVFQEAINKLFGRRVELEAFADSRTLFNLVANNSCKTE